SPAAGADIALEDTSAEVSFSFGEGKAEASKAKQRRAEVERMPEHISVDPKTALVEEIQAKVYDTAKSRVLTLLEVIMGGDNRPSGSAVNRLVGYLLQDIEDVIW